MLPLDKRAALERIAGLSVRWCPFAVQRPGPVWKAGYPSLFLPGVPKLGEVKHSAEGGWAGAHSVLDGTARSSWQFTIGEYIEQHYPVDAYCWHGGDLDDDGGVRANIQLVGVEHLGMRPTPIDDTQVALSAKLSRWLMETNGYTLAVRGLGAGAWSLYEHNEVSDVPTACPSGRIRWPELMAQIGGGDMFVRFNRTSAHFAQQLTYQPGEHFMRLATDLEGLPTSAKVVELDVRIDQASKGELIMRDGDGNYADVIDRYVPRGVVKVIPDNTAERRVKFTVAKGSVRITLVGCVGYWL